MGFKQVLGLVAIVAMLSACESTSDNRGAAAGTGAQTSTGSMTSGDLRTWQEVTQRVGDRVFFEFDRSDLQPDARRTVETWANFLKGNPSVTATVEGHADERGTRDYNLALGDRRANAVKSYLNALGVAPNRIRTVSFGKERPAVAGHNEGAWSQNRRAVLVPAGAPGS